MDIFSFIKKNISIESVVSEYTTLKRAGNYLKGRCPFHHEKTASFTISPGKEIYYCFGCHQGGDAIMFISQVEKCTQKEAALLLAERYKIAIPENDYTPAIPREKKDRYFFIYQIISRFLAEQYEKSSHAHDYVKNRGISEQLRKHFGIGYFPGGKTAIQTLLTYAHKESILAKELLETHIIMSADSSYYSPFEDRLIVPIMDVLGRVCGFGGRIFRPEDTRAKYYNSHENEFFTKGNILFGLSQAKEHIRQKKAVFVVEGYMDCILMAQYGYENTVATLGTACTESHLKQLSRYSDTLYIVYDGDSAGKNALMRIAEKCWRANVEPIVLSLPKDDDPASYLIKHKTLDAIIKEKQNIFSFFISTHTESIAQKTLNEKMQAIKSILEILINFDDPIKQNILLSQASKALLVDVDALKKELIRMQQKHTNYESKNDSPLPIEKSLQKQPTFLHNENEHESIKQILGGMLQNPQFLDPLLVELCCFSEDQDIRIVSEQINDYMASSTSDALNFDAIWQYLPENSRLIVSQLIMQSDTPLDPSSFKQHAQQFERHMFKRVVHSFKIQLSESMQENNREKTEKLLQQLVTIQKKFKRETYIS